MKDEQLVVLLGEVRLVSGDEKILDCVALERHCSACDQTRLNEKHADLLNLKMIHVSV